MNGAHAALLDLLALVARRSTIDAVSDRPHPTPLRKSARRFDPGGGVHFLTFSCFQRRPFFEEPGLRGEFVEAIGTARTRHRFRLLAWVIMPEHVHLMLVPTKRLPENGSALPSILMGLKRPFGSMVKSRWGRAGLHADAPRFWQAGGGFDRNVRDFDELVREIRYIHQNPVARGLVPAPTDWLWSSARCFAGCTDAVLEIDATTFDRREFPGARPGMYLG